MFVKYKNSRKISSNSSRQEHILVITNLQYSHNTHHKHYCKTGHIIEWAQRFKGLLFPKLL